MRLSIFRLVAAFCVAVSCLVLLSPLALAAPDLATAEKTLDDARKQLDGIDKGLGDEVTDERLVAARDAALALQRRVDDLANELTPELARLQARVTELGEAPESGEAPDVAQQRGTLDKQLNQLDAQVKLARLLNVESAQAIERIQALRRSGFQTRLFEQVASLLSPVFWQELAATAPRDLSRAGQLVSQLADNARATPGGVWLLLLLIVAVVMVTFVSMRGALLRFSATRVPAGRLRRSALAAAKTLMPTLAGFLIIMLFSQGLVWAQPLPPTVDGVRGLLVGAVTFGTYIASLGYALLSPRRPSWRLPPLPDLLAARLRRFPLMLGTAIGAGFLVARLATLINVTLVTTVALNALIALVIGLILVRGLRRSRDALRELRSATASRTVGKSDAGGTDETGSMSMAEAPGAGGPDAATSTAMSPASSPAASPAASSTASPAAPSSRIRPLEQPWWTSLLGGTAWLLVIISLACVLGGFVALGSFVVQQIAWITIVACSVYLFGALIDDASMALLAGGSGNNAGSGTGTSGGDGRRDGGLDAQGRLVAQSAVLISAVGRILLAMLAVVMILAPFGENPRELMTRAGSAGMGITIGEIQLRPGLVVQALLVLVIGLVLVHFGQRWLANRFLPTTRIDPAMRSSVTRLLGYLGMIVAVSVALSAVGLGLERVAWVASALSVGIGFGLQAVVSNFVAGLILLVERPVRVGDWVAVSGVEGDIRRINVRATEIQTGDRSTVIVPNSEFITKIVRNVTLANPLGVVSIRLPMPLDTDIDRVRDILTASLMANSDVLATPAPGISLDSVEATSLVFSLSASVSSPRRVAGVKSALLFDILRRLREANVTLVRPSSAVKATGTDVAAPDAAGG